MAEPVKSVFVNEIASLNAVKRAVLELAKSSSSPTVHNASRLAIDHLDLTYLCLCNLNSMAAEFSQEAVENAAEAALAGGKLVIKPEA